MNDDSLKILCNIIGGVETGGQIYGNRRYDAYKEPDKKIPNEHTITLGWAQYYGYEANKLIKRIKEKDPKTFYELDTCDPSINTMLNKDWVKIHWYPTEAQKNVLKNLITTKVGRECQDELFYELMNTFITDCEDDYTSSVPAIIMYCEIRHLGGKSAVNRIFNRCNGNYSLENIMASLVADQRDTSSSNQVGDKIFWSRHVKCNQWIQDYVKEDNPVAYDPYAVLAVAEDEVGYLEKASNANLYDKTANAGYGNYTKYGKDLYEWTKGEAGDTYGVSYQWCDQFVDWCFVKAYGYESAKKLLGGWSAYTPTSASYYKKMGRWSNTPAVGAQIFFHNSERICHTGLVYNYDANYVYTIEGNTSAGSSVVPNGGGVYRKSYSRSNSRISGYGIPDYGETVEPDTPLRNNVAIGQAWLNQNYARVLSTYCGALLIVDGKYGTKTRAGALAVWKDLMNRKFGTSLDPSNENFYSKTKLTASNARVMMGTTGTFTYICELILSARGYYNGDMDGLCGNGLRTAIANFQTDKSLKVDGVCGADTWEVLFN